VIFEDDECDRDADDPVGDASAKGDGDRAGDDAEGDEAVGRVRAAVGDQSRAGEPASATESDLGCDLVADESNRECCG
jgi:hypothetical protein